MDSTDDQASSFGRRLAQYWDARNEYLALGARIAPNAQPAQLLTDAVEPLLQLVQRSRDFGPASNTLIGIAQRIGQVRPDVARQLLVQLHDVNPEQHDVTELLTRFERTATHRPD